MCVSTLVVIGIGRGSVCHQVSDKISKESIESTLISSPLCPEKQASKWLLTLYSKSNTMRRGGILWFLNGLTEEDGKI